MQFLTKHLSSIAALCEKHKVRHLFAFGSVLTSRFSDRSDVDLVVDFENIPEDIRQRIYLKFEDCVMKSQIDNENDMISLPDDMMSF